MKKPYYQALADANQRAAEMVQKALAPDNTHELITATIKDMVSCLLFYDRKEDEDLPRGAIEDYIRSGESRLEEIVALFRSELIKGAER